ncbi:MAG: DUF357 domain-containing protein [Methanomicrobiales archaeon]|nr:DUF357 domain-containing protein [Methanomicrobiales archaeon]
MNHPACPFLSPSERLPASCREKLAEKTHRYERLLNTARTSVTPAPDPSTPLFLLATRTLEVADAYAGRGAWLSGEDGLEDALAAFSYGHGWLDAGTRAGLFVIHAERDIFTV